LEPSEVTEEPYPEIGITEETRRMYPDNYTDKINKVLDSIIEDMYKKIELPKPKHDILLDELVIMYDAHMTIGGEQNRFNASVLKAAINVIRAL
jgi:hypothetical protein